MFDYYSENILEIVYLCKYKEEIEENEKNYKIDSSSVNWFLVQEDTSNLWHWVKLLLENNSNIKITEC